MIEDKTNPALQALLGGAEIEITVGIHEAEGDEDHDGLTNAELGAIHEYGSGDIPERPFIRGYFDEKSDDVERFINEAAERVLSGEDPLTAAELVALQLESGVKERMMAGIAPELHESTRRKRGEDAIPLIATSQLLGSIRGKATVK